MIAALRARDERGAEAEEWVRVEQQRDDIKELDVSGNQLTAGMWEAIGDLSALEKLVARGGLTALPASVCRLQMLKELDVSDNQLTELPEAVGDLSALEKLNQLTEREAATTSSRRCPRRCAGSRCSRSCT